MCVNAWDIRSVVCVNAWDIRSVVCVNAWDIRSVEMPVTRYYSFCPVYISIFQFLLCMYFIGFSCRFLTNIS